ncbi:hypothetical protein AUK22_01440 [bacterium CG2_30_54_10]|nr:MAG: hypothetical protein AUK22_01440 [bacterium CG2_30_54_10]
MTRISWRIMIALLLMPFFSHPSFSAVDWRSEVLYFVLLDRFCDGDSANDFQVDEHDPKGFHGGDLKGLQAKLDYLQKLGVTAIWLSPIFRNRPFKFFGQQPYHGYWIWDFFSVDPRFGTMDDLKALSAEIHRRGMKLVLDFVVNHADYNAPLAAHFPHWFHETGNIENWEDQSERETHRIFGLPDFASEKPVVKSLFQAVACHWITVISPDGFRLDAVKHVPVDFWNDFNHRISARHGHEFLLLGEMLDGDPKVIGRVARDGAFNSLFDYPLYYTLLEVIAGRGDCRKLGTRLYEDRRYPDPNLMATFLDNHDLDRFLTSCGGNRNRYRLALGLLFTLRGIPTLTYGDESGLEGRVQSDAANRGDMRFGADPDLASWVADLAHLRRENPSLAKGIQINLAMGPNHYAFARILEDEVAVVALNNATRTAHLVLPCGRLFPERARYPQRDPKRCDSCVAEVWGDKLEVDIPPEHLAIFINWGPSEPRKAAFRLALALRSDPEGAGLVPVTFHLREAGIPSNAVPRVIGGLKQLGDWDPNAVLPEMTRVSPGAWRVTLWLPKYAAFEYKFCYKTASETIWYPENNLFGQTTDRPPQLPKSLAR